MGSGTIRRIAITAIRIAPIRHAARRLLHLVDASSGDPEAIVADWRLVRDELAAYADTLAAKPEIVGLTKSDSLAAEDIPVLCDMVADLLPGRTVLPLSSVAGTGVTAVLRACWPLVRARRTEAEAEAEPEGVAG